MATYLDLVNFVVRESGQDLAELTSGEFASPPDRMYEKIKNWVRQAARQIQLERNEWEFRRKEGVALLYPRIEFYDLLSSGGTPDGDAVSTETDKAFATGPAIFTSSETGFSDIIGLPNTTSPINAINRLNFRLRMGETINFGGTPVDCSYRFKRWGTYNLTDQNYPLDTDLSDVSTIDLNTMTVLPDTTTDTVTRTLQFVPWEKINDSWWSDIASLGTPQFYTKTPNGRFMFYPKLDQPMRFRFEYTSTEDELTNATDTPSWLPEKWHDGIGWLATSYYGDFEDPKVAQRAFRRWWNIKQQMERDIMPVVSLSPLRMW